MHHTSAEWSEGCIQDSQYIARPCTFNGHVALIFEALESIDVDSGQLLNARVPIKLTRAASTDLKNCFPEATIVTLT